MNVADDAVIGEGPKPLQQPAAPSGPTAGAGTSSSQTPTNPILSADHIDILTARAIDMQVAARAGLASVDAVEGAQLLGRTDVLASGGLAIPYPATNPPYVRVRMDAGDARYLARGGVEVPVYVPVGIDASGSSELFVVEGPLKALSLASLALNAVGLGGVSTTLEKGEPPRLNSSWGAVTLNDRPVTIVFDADRATNPMVAYAEARLAMALETAGAVVSIAELPHGPSGKSRGPDDFIATQGSTAFSTVIGNAVAADPVARVQTLLSLPNGKQQIAPLLGDYGFLAAIAARGPHVELQIKQSFMRGATQQFADALKRFRKQLAAQRTSTPALSSFTDRYVVQDGRICIQDASQEGATTVPLCNFTARIAEDVSSEDGAQTERLFVLDGELDNGIPLGRVTVTPTEFLKGTWPTEKWGAPVIISPDRDALRHLAVAIQSLSTPAPVTARVCTGWVNAGGSWVYVHADGMVASGIVPIEVRLPGELSRYRLPGISSADLTVAASEVEAFAELLTDDVGLVVLSAVFRAPLASARWVPGVLHLVGPSGGFKTSIGLVMMSFFGEFDAAPAAWSDTAASIEHAAFSAQDALLLIDDASPKTADARDEHRSRMSMLIRAIGNQKGRGRMRSNLTAHTTRPPRALVVSTGEDSPQEESIVARCLLVPIRREAVDVAALTALQQARTALSVVMRAFLEWLATKYDAVAYDLDQVATNLRSKLHGTHARTGPLVAEIMVGLDVYLRFAKEKGLLSDEAIAIWKTRALAAADKLLKTQGGDQRSRDPVRRFLEVLAELVQSRTLPMLRAGNEPQKDQRPPIGWYDAQHLYFLPDAAFAMVNEQMRRGGESMPVVQRSLWRRLVDRNVAEGDGDHLTVKRKFAGGARVLKLRRAEVDKLLEATFPVGMDVPTVPDADDASRSGEPSPMSRTNRGASS